MSIGIATRIHFPHILSLVRAVQHSKLPSLLSRCERSSRGQTVRCRFGSQIQLSCYSVSFSGTSRNSTILCELRQRSKKQRTLVFQSTTDNPYHNLAIEHYLLTNSDPESRILFFYTNRPCVVYGRNQNPWVECNLKLIQDGLQGKSVDLVRRRSGGGTVFHDEGNLNFSFIVPNDKDFTRKKHSELVVRALNKIQSVSAEYDGPENLWVNDRHDITMATLQNKGRTEFKVSGSAYKITRGRALHHGTLLHSSPNLDNISRLLRAPGKDYINAKGVASVRSPVMNLFNVQNADERDMLRTHIMEKITSEFVEAYHSEASPEFVGDQDCKRDINQNIADGIEELMTDAWRFEQTPSFDFASHIIGSKQVTFTVRNGSIEHPRLGPEELPIELREELHLKSRAKLHEIQNWRDVFDEEDVDGDQLATVAQVFPNMRNLLYNKDVGIELESRVVKQEKNTITRLLPHGRMEQESGSNTVEEVAL